MGGSESSINRSYEVITPRFHWASKLFESKARSKSLALSDPVAAIHALTDGGVDLAVEAVGSGAVARQAFDALAPGGRAIVAGLTGFAEEIRVPVVSLLLDKSLCGSIYGSADPARDFPRLFALCARGELEIEGMAGPDQPLDKVNDAFEALASGRAVRPRVIFEGGA
jgi:Zn-dependent alcohol dehydrogenase